MDRRPLAHLTVVDLTANVPGPFCSTVLGDFGARVIKVEPPGGDPLRHSPGMFEGLNRGKQSIELDLKAPEGREVLGRLAGAADVVLEGSRPGVAARLGADYPALSARNPGLVYCSISGFGQDGPWRDRPGHDINYLALSGYLGVQAEVEGRPWPPPILVSDLASGLYAAIAVLAAVAGRQRSGEGAYLDLSMAEAALALLGPEVARLSADGRPGQPNVTHIPHYGVFPCADGGWISLGIVHEDHFWERFCGEAGLDGLAHLGFAERLAGAGEIRDALGRVFLSRTAADWETALTGADVPAARVAGLAEAFDSPQFRARGAFVELGLHRHVAQPVRLSTASIAPATGAPVLDEHRDLILAELDGRSPGRADRSEAEGSAAR